jgi:peroxiredoxin Q/BCP
MLTRTLVNGQAILAQHAKIPNQRRWELWTVVKFISNFASTALVFFGLSSSVAGDVLLGEQAPDFRLQDQNGEWHSLTDYTGTWVAVYFYPKDDTPGCTKEACAFRDNIFAFEDIGAVILGISLDDVESHAAFAEKYSLPFPILSDADAAIAKEYGVYKEMGTFKFAERQSFLINPDGQVAKHYAKVNAEKHSEEVLADLKLLMAAPSS